MPAINFSVFKDKLVRAEKFHTIRKSLPKGWRAGKPLSLYTGMRTKGCHKLIDTFCGGFFQLDFDFNKKEISFYSPVYYPNRSNEFILVYTHNMQEPQISILAKNDGFESVEDFWEYFKDYKEPCYLLHFDMERFTPTQWALEALEKGVLK